MTDKRIIRAASTADIETLRDLGYRTYREHFPDLWSPGAMENFLERDFSREALARSLAMPESVQWTLVLDAGRAVGFCKMNWARPDPIEGERGAELQKIYFLADEAGKGHGAAAMAWLLRQANAHGEAMMWLQVVDSNAGAYRFYQRGGFADIGETRFSTDEGTLHMHVMKRRLP